MFSLREFVKQGLLDAVGQMPDYKVILQSVGWLEKDVLTESDLAEIQEKINAQYQTEEVTEEPIA